MASSKQKQTDRITFFCFVIVVALLECYEWSSRIVVSCSLVSLSPWVGGGGGGGAAALWTDWCTTVVELLFAPAACICFAINRFIGEYSGSMIDAIIRVLQV